MKIVVEKLGKSFADTLAVDDISLELNQGAIHTLQGPSGSGKTTLLRLIAGLDVPDNGRIFIDERLCSTPKSVMPPHERNLGFVFQQAALWPHMTVAQNILFGIQHLAPSDRRARLNEILVDMELVRLENRYPRQLSGGQARRVSLGRTMAPQPRYLLCDEPMVHLEPELKARLLEWLKVKSKQWGFGVLYVTHDPHEAATLGGIQRRIEHGRLAG